MNDELYQMFLDVENALTNTIRKRAATFVDEQDQKRMKQLHKRLASLAQDVADPEWLRRPAKEAA